MATSRRVPLVLWIGAAIFMIALGIGAARYGATREVTPIGRARPELPEVLAWCAPGLEPIVGGGCFAPAGPNAPTPTPLLVYLHGRFEATAPEGELERQKRVAERATARGFAVLALRGRVGQCLQPELAGWVCWPASERTVDAGPGYVA